MSKLHKAPEDWAKVKVERVLAGSQDQIGNVLRMALQDIQRLAQERDVLADAYLAAQARKGNSYEEAIEI